MPTVKKKASTRKKPVKKKPPVESVKEEVKVESKPLVKNVKFKVRNDLVVNKGKTVYVHGEVYELPEAKLAQLVGIKSAKDKSKSIIVKL